MDLRKLKTLLDLFESSNLQEMEFCEGEERVRLTKPSLNTIVSQAPVYAEAPVTLPPAASPQKPATESSDETGQMVESPMVGTFYRSSSPENSPFVQKGDKVIKGQTLCIIEAMKLMNEIASTADGTVKEILIENGNPVAYGTPLFLLE